MRLKIRFYIIATAFILLTIMIFDGPYYYHSPSLNQSKQTLITDKYDKYVDMIERDFNFVEDVLALVHIQKTSGTLWEKLIISHLSINVENTWMESCKIMPGLPRPICYRNIHRKQFFWDRYTDHYCDIHADYTELSNCIMFDYNNRIRIINYRKAHFYGIIHFFTMLRNPVHRYISEFQHVKRGATWNKAVRVCTGEFIYSKKCYSSSDWTNATWQEFLSCEYNLANNRMTRMLANYNLLGCRILKCWTHDGKCNEEEKRMQEKRLLESAKQTLLSMSFFGLTENQSLSQYLFEKTFKGVMRFTKKVDDPVNEYENSEEMKSLDVIRRNNHLDIQLYEFARDLFFKRINYFKEKDSRNTLIKIF